MMQNLAGCGTMRFRVTLAALVLLLFGGASYFIHRGQTRLPPAKTSPGNTGDRSAVRLVPDVVDFGDQMWETELPFSATLVNDSAEPVSITRITTSCGCTVVNDEPLLSEPVAPGARVSFSGTLRTQGNTGPIERRVRISTKDTGQFELTLRVTVRRTWTIDPDTVDFGRINLDSDHVECQVAAFRSEVEKLVGVATMNDTWLSAEIVRGGDSPNS